MVMIWLAGLALAAAGVQAAAISGRVWVDGNGDGQYTVGEAVLPRVCVSDGWTVARTDAAGRYRLPAGEGETLVRLSVPSGYWPEGGHWYLRLAAAQTTADFPLQAQRQATPWQFVQVTDIHYLPAAEKQVAAWDRQVAALHPAPALVIATGDLVMDSNPVADETIVRRLFAEYLAAMTPLPAPLLNLPGNHDHPGVSSTMPTDGPVWGLRGYEALVGPAWYSLNYAGVHLIAVDASTIDPLTGKLTPGLPSRCEDWLRRDLALTPREQPLLLLCHQPPDEWHDGAPVEKLLQGRRVLGIFCGHLHTSNAFQFAGFPGWIGGALCGSWWTGPCPDGKPRGFRLVTVKSDAVDTTYVEAAKAP
jgi:predicted MPP superfamily phosphohydrolase